MRRWRQGILAAAGLLSLASNGQGGSDPVTATPVTVSVYPQTVMAGGAVRLRCTVPKDPANRWLDYGLDGYTGSGRQLDGAAAPVTYQVTVDHLPCDVGPAYCRLTRAGKPPVTATRAVLVAACGDPEF